MMKLIDSIKVNNELGESVLWDEKTQSVWWIDIFGKKIFRLKWPSKNLEVYSTEERPCAIGSTKDENRLIVAFETGVCLYDPKLKCVAEWIYRPFKLNGGIRFNDGKVDRQGRFWISTMIESAEDISVSKSGLYCIEANGKVTQHLSDFSIGNSIAWSPCSTKMYFSDSHQQTIWQFDFDATLPELSRKKAFFKLESPAFPDGADIDSEENLWCTNWGDSSITQYDRNHTEKKANNIKHSLPILQPTCLAFGGPSLDLLFVSSATYLLSNEDLQNYPDSGSVLVYKTNCKGIAAQRFGETI